MYKIRRVLRFLLTIAVLAVSASATTAVRPGEMFDVRLIFDYASAEQALELYEGKLISTAGLSELRGSRIAASTTGLIASRRGDDGLLLSYLDSLRFRNLMFDDIFQLEAARDRAAEIRELLTEMKRRNFSSRIISTVGQIFPPDAQVQVNIPVYVVAFGHENVDAYVRRIVWHGNRPEFTGDDRGELTIVINLAHAAGMRGETEERLISILTIAAHEVFHAAFGAYKDQSADWKRYYRKFNRPFDRLLDLIHNEGIAYYLSLEQQGGGALPRDWYSRTRTALGLFNQHSRELLSPEISGRRAAEILRSANLSGYWESFGAMTGMFMAREIDNGLGRAALIETIANGPWDFLSKYVHLTSKDSNLPEIHSSIQAQIPVR